jgi:hypothetical protein
VDKYIILAFAVQMGLFLPLQVYFFIRTRQEKEEVKDILKEGLKQALFIVRRRG